MANNKKSESSSSTKTRWFSLNKLSMYTLIAVAVLYLVATILTVFDATKLAGAVRALQSVATAIMICIVGVLAWRYVAKKPFVWKLLYIVCLLLVLVGIVIPLVK